MQLTLFTLDPAPLPCEPAVTTPRVLESPRIDEPEVDSRQLPLFSAWTALTGELERALSDADFVTARDVRTRIESTYGAESLPPWAALLDDVATGLWEPLDLRAALATWRRLDAALRGTPQRAAFRRGFFRRLFCTRVPEDIVAERPDATIVIANALLDLDESVRARRIVRDALLEGRLVEGTIDDERVADLLAEDLEPRWLASLGAIRHLWPVPLPDAEERAAIAATLATPAPEDDAARAEAFWHVLRFAECRSALREPERHAARRRLKRLHPELHAAYVDRSGPFA